jgi:hypothetical protein
MIKSLAQKSNILCDDDPRYITTEDLLVYKKKPVDHYRWNTGTAYLLIDLNYA